MTAYLGVYERESFRLEIRERDGQLVGHLAEDSGGLPDGGVKEAVLQPVDPAMGIYVSTLMGEHLPLTLRFLQLTDGSRYVHTGGRATPKR